MRSLLLAHELSRGAEIPDIPGFETHCFRCKVNLWWRDGRRASQAFSDVLPTDTGKFALLAAKVHDSVDSAGAAHTFRAYLRAALQKEADLVDALPEVLALVRDDNQWNFLASLAACVLDCNRCELELASFGEAEIHLMRQTESRLQRIAEGRFLPLMRIDETQVPSPLSLS